MCELLASNDHSAEGWITSKAQTNSTPNLNMTATLSLEYATPVLNGQTINGLYHLAVFFLYFVLDGSLFFLLEWQLTYY